jgi:hypothetical protein
METSIVIAIISASSVLVGGLATAAIQHWLAKATVSREDRKQRRAEFRSRFEECVVRLLEQTDPDIHPVPSIPEITRDIIRLQLYLDLEDNDHRDLNSYLNRLAISISEFSESQDKKLVLREHGAVLDAANRLLRKYNR